MTYFKLNTILACSVGICMAVTGPTPSTIPAEDGKTGDKETLHPRTKTPRIQENPEKAPTPALEDKAPARDAPTESPAGTEDKKDCDECVLVDAGTPGKPIALANTLWGLFCLGGGRWIPSTRIKGLVRP